MDAIAKRIYINSFILGLDPARPLIEQHASRDYRLTQDDADVVQIIHTNAGTLGQLSLSGSLDLCINGGRLQPFCRRGFQLSKILIAIETLSLKFKYNFVTLNRSKSMQPFSERVLFGQCNIQA